MNNKPVTCEKLTRLCGATRIVTVILYLFKYSYKYVSELVYLVNIIIHANKIFKKHFMQKQIKKQAYI